MPFNVGQGTNCECCRLPGAKVRAGVTTWKDSGHKAVNATLCDACSVGQHYAGACKVAVEGRPCGTVVWKCGQLSHVSTHHPRLLEQRANVPEPPPLAPRFKKLGTINIPEGDN